MSERYARMENLTPLCAKKNGLFFSNNCTITFGFGPHNSRGVISPKKDSTLEKEGRPFKNTTVVYPLLMEYSYKERTRVAPVRNIWQESDSSMYIDYGNGKSVTVKQKHNRPIWDQMVEVFKYFNKVKSTLRRFDPNFYVFSITRSI